MSRWSCGWSRTGSAVRINAALNRLTGPGHCLTTKFVCKMAHARTSPRRRSCAGSNASIPPAPRNVISTERARTYPNPRRRMLDRKAFMPRFAVPTTRTRRMPRAARANRTTRKARSRRKAGRTKLTTVSQLLRTKESLSGAMATLRINSRTKMILCRTPQADGAPDQFRQDQHEPHAAQNKHWYF